MDGVLNDRQGDEQRVKVVKRAGQWEKGEPLQGRRGGQQGEGKCKGTREP
jgi:hypothetical protein